MSARNSRSPLRARDHVEHSGHTPYTDWVLHARRGWGLGESLARYPWVVVLFAIAFSAFGYLWSSQQAERYTAATQLFLSHSSAFDGVGQSGYVSNPDRYAINQASLATSRPVLDRAIESGDLDIDVRDLRQSLTVTAGRGTDVIVIESTAGSPAEAASQANAVAGAYRSLKEDEVERQTEQLTSLSTTDADRAAVLKRAAVYGDGIELIEEATEPLGPSSPQPLRDTMLAFIVGAAVGSAVAVATDLLRRRHRDGERQQSTVRRRRWSSRRRRAELRPSTSANGHERAGVAAAEVGTGDWGVDAEASPFPDRMPEKDATVAR